MSTPTATRPARTVSAVCACGASFEREVKRGRPQVWCPACIDVPFAQRTHVVAPTATTDDGVTTVTDRIKNDNDPLDAFRVTLEAEVAAVYADHKSDYASYISQGHSTEVAAEWVHKASSEAVLAIYAKYRGN